MSVNSIQPSIEKAIDFDFADFLVFSTANAQDAYEHSIELSISDSLVIIRSSGAIDDRVDWIMLTGLLTGLSQIRQAELGIGELELQLGTPVGNDMEKVFSKAIKAAALH